METILSRGGSVTVVVDISDMCQVTRPCKNELQKEYCVKIKLIALVCQ